MDNWFFWQMTPQWLRILWHVAPVEQVQELIVAVDWFFVVEQIVDAPKRSCR